MTVQPLLERAEVTGRSKHLAHVHVVGLEFEQLGQRFRHGLEAATEVEPHGVLRWRRRDDHVGVAGGEGDLLELLGQTAADTRRTQRCADVEECQLRDPGPEVWHDDTDANQPSAGERTERDPAGVDVVLERVHLGLDGVFAVTVRVPGRRAPVAVPRDELCAVLVVEHVDAFPTVDLAGARQLGPAQPSELDCGFHRLTLAHGRFMSSGPWPAARALSNESATVPIEGRAPISSRRSVKRTDVDCEPASECATSPTRRRPLRERRAISDASRTIAVLMFTATRQPTIRRENASTIKHTYAIPERVGTFVRSVTHNASGRSAVKLRLTRSGARTASGSEREVHTLAPSGHTVDVQPTHQSHDLISADVMPGSSGRLPQLVRPVDLAVGHPQHHQHLHHHHVTQRPRREPPTAA